jgi:hypothetical protein
MSDIGPAAADGPASGVALDLRGHSLSSIMVLNFARNAAALSSQKGRLRTNKSKMRAMAPNCTNCECAVVSPINMNAYVRRFEEVGIWGRIGSQACLAGPIHTEPAVTVRTRTFCVEWRL